MKEAVNGIPASTETVIDTIARHLLVDGFPMVIDLEQSQGCRLVDARSGRTYLDFFMFFASVPIGFNHPLMVEEDFVKKLGTVAVESPNNQTRRKRRLTESIQSV